MKPGLLFLLCAAVVGFSCVRAEPSRGAKKWAERPPPRAVLIAVVDQFAFDAFMRLIRLRPQSRMSRLANEGSLFLDARYEQSNTSTGPGHACLITGAEPSQTGVIAGSRWNGPRFFGLRETA